MSATHPEAASFAGAPAFVPDVPVSLVFHTPGGGSCADARNSVQIPSISCPHCVVHQEAASCADAAFESYVKMGRDVKDADDVAMLAVHVTGALENLPSLSGFLPPVRGQPIIGDFCEVSSCFGVVSSMRHVTFPT